MTELYPEIESYDHGMLDVGDGNLVYWETCGNPHGKPAVVLHGGPGSGCSTGVRRFFDPSAYRIVLFDQRGVAAVRRMRVTRARTSRSTRPNTCLRTSNACGSTVTSTSGCCSAALGVLHSDSPTPSETRSGSLQSFSSA